MVMLIYASIHYWRLMLLKVEIFLLQSSTGV
ncbi:Uncharacterised protein [Vibrio cholerae]|nr:Uncharacterised protein [Vibrio cholerae]